MILTGQEFTKCRPRSLQRRRTQIASGKRDEVDTIMSCKASDVQQQYHVYFQSYPPVGHKRIQNLAEGGPVMHRTCCFTYTELAAIRGGLLREVGAIDTLVRDLRCKTLYNRPDKGVVYRR